MTAAGITIDVVRRIIRHYAGQHVRVQLDGDAPIISGWLDGDMLVWQRADDGETQWLFAVLPARARKSLYSRGAAAHPVGTRYFSITLLDRVEVVPCELPENGNSTEAATE